MKIEMDEKMVAFIISHFKKRIEFRKKHMPEYIDDPWLRFVSEADEEQSRPRQAVAERKKKALEFIHNATLVIETLEK